MNSRRSIIYTLLIFSYLSITCNKNDNISNTDPEKFFVLSGIVTDSNTNQPIISATVIADTTITSTDSAGHFKFDGLREGFYRIKAVCAEYDTTFLDVFLNDSLDVHLALNRSWIDYLPLYVGQKLNYNKTYLTIAYEDSGTAVWEVTDVIVQDTLTTYKIRETFNGVHTIPYYDTTYVSNIINYYNIKETRDHKIYLYNLTDNIFSRYYPPDSEDIIHIYFNDPSYITTIDLKKEKGMIYLKSGHNGMSSAFTITLTLLDQ